MSTQLEHAFSFIEPIKALYVKVVQAQIDTPTQDEFEALIREYKKIMQDIKKCAFSESASQLFLGGLRSWIKALIHPLSEIGDRAFPGPLVPSVRDRSTGEVLTHRYRYYSDLLDASG